MSSDDTSFDVRVWSIQLRHGKRGGSYGVRWSVAGRPKRRTFATAKLADGFRAELLAAVRSGRPFELDSGLPRVLAHERGSVTWLAHARSYAAAKWPYVSPNHRRGIAETLTDLSLELTTSPALNEDDVTPLRHLLLRRAFVPTGGTSAEAQAELARLEKRSRAIRDLASPQVTRQALERLGRRIDGSPAAPSTLARKRAVFHNVLEVAVEAGHLQTNPLDAIRVPRRPVNAALDSRVVVNPEQAAALISAVGRQAPALEAFFATIYYAGLRPSEALGLTLDRLDLPSTGWGAITVVGSQQSTPKVWTDDGSSRQSRPLKHRPRGAARQAPAPPELVRILHHHLEAFACGEEGHLFVARTGKAGRPLAPPYQVTVGANTIYRAWDRARRTVLGDSEYQGPLARRPYDLRHAYVSTWLSAGVSPADIAAQAGHSVHVMLKVYSQQVAGQQQRNQALVERLLGDEP